MIIEFVGSTGAGKTTLACEVQHRLAEKAQGPTAFAVIADRLGLWNVTNPTIRNFAQDLVALPFFFRSLFRNWPFVVFALKAVSRHTSNKLFALNYLRSIVRRIGTHELLRRRQQDRIILVDEGTVLSAHLLFVYTNSEHSHDEIETFARLVPLPDLIVYVRAPVESLVQRALHRSDPRKEMKAKRQSFVEKHVRRAATLFDQLAATREIRPRVLIVENPASMENERSVLADHIANFIMNHRPGVEIISTVQAGRIKPLSC